MNDFADDLRREYDAHHKVTDEDREKLPDTQNAGRQAILGSPVAVQQVGAANFRLPLSFLREGGAVERLETAVTGTVALEAGVRGINMSRIMRAFYAFHDTVFEPGTLEAVLESILETVGAREGRLRLDFSYPMSRGSLRSGMVGYQYYDAAYEGLLGAEGFRSRLHFDFIYSSACPGSSDLAEHARQHRQVYAIPHSQRSLARISVTPAPGAAVRLEALQRLCLAALQTEVQVMVRREDEQAFAELNGAFPKFVEDAARLLFEQLAAEEAIHDFRVVCAHFESLHAHDAVAVAVKGTPGGFRAEVDDFRELVR